MAEDRLTMHAQKEFFIFKPLGLGSYRSFVEARDEKVFTGSVPVFAARGEIVGQENALVAGFAELFCRGVVFVSAALAAAYRLTKQEGQNLVQCLKLCDATTRCFIPWRLNHSSRKALAIAAVDSTYKAFNSRTSWQCNFDVGIFAETSEQCNDVC